MEYDEICQAIKCNNLSTRPENCGECIAPKLKPYINKHYLNPNGVYENIVKQFEEIHRDK